MRPDRRRTGRSPASRVLALVEHPATERALVGLPLTGLDVRHDGSTIEGARAYEEEDRA